MKKLTLLFRVVCLSCGDETCRHKLQTRLMKLNEHHITQSTKQAPDGDVHIPDDYAETFQMVDCQRCGGMLKPKVSFDVEIYVEISVLWV